MSYEAWGEPDDSRFEAAMEAGWIDPTDLSKAILDVMNERDRQWNEEHFDPAHDDRHVKGELARAGAAYAVHASYTDKVRHERTEKWRNQPPSVWPQKWARNWWKPKDRRRDLVRAAALLIAEIERLDRRAEAQE